MSAGRRHSGAGRARPSPLGGASTSARRSRESGAVYVELLVVILPILLLFFGVLQLLQLGAAQWIVRRAASATVRAAVVVIPDNGRFYRDPKNNDVNKFSGERKDDVEKAAKAVLSAAWSLRNHESEVGVRLSPSKDFKERELVTAEVMAYCDCFPGFLGYACGWDRTVTLSASASLPYQGADYGYPDSYSGN